jgi:hypothetical protein
MFHDEFHERCGIIEAVGMVLEAVLHNHFDFAAQRFVPLLENHCVFFVGDHLIRVARAVDDGYMRCG